MGGKKKVFLHHQDSTGYSHHFYSATHRFAHLFLYAFARYSFNTAVFIPSSTGAFLHLCLLSRLIRFWLTILTVLEARVVRGREAAFLLCHASFTFRSRFIPGSEQRLWAAGAASARHTSTVQKKTYFVCMCVCVLHAAFCGFRTGLVRELEGSIPPPPVQTLSIRSWGRSCDWLSVFFSSSTHHNLPVFQDSK